MKLAQQHADKALELRHKGDVSGALQEQLKAVELDGKNVKLWVNLTGYYLEVNDLAKAKEAVQKALALDSKDAWAHYLYGEVLEKLHDNHNALAQRALAVQLEPDNPTFWTNLGSTQEAEGNNEAAREAYSKALQLAPKDIAAMYRLGALEGEVGNLERAIELLERAANTPPAEYDDEVFIEAARKELAKIRSKVAHKKP